jgi:hypothetical protein
MDHRRRISITSDDELRTMIEEANGQGPRVKAKCSFVDVAWPAKIQWARRIMGGGSEVDVEQIDTGGRVDEMDNAFAQKYGTAFVLKDEVPDCQSR